MTALICLIVYGTACFIQGRAHATNADPRVWLGSLLVAVISTSIILRITEGAL